MQYIEYKPYVDKLDLRKSLLIYSNPMWIFDRPK